MKIRALLAALALVLLFVSDTAGSASEVLVRRPATAPWIEVYHDGPLTSEWQPVDGPAYAMLDLLLEDELPFRAPRKSATPS